MDRIIAFYIILIYRERENARTPTPVNRVMHLYIYIYIWLYTIVVLFKNFFLLFSDERTEPRAKLVYTKTGLKKEKKNFYKINRS